MILPLILSCLPSVSSESMSSQTDQEGGFELSFRHYVHYAYSLHNHQISWGATWLAVNERTGNDTNNSTVFVSMSKVFKLLNANLS